MKIKNKWLVTGGMGFIGKYLVEHLLSNGESVKVMDIAYNAEFGDAMIAKYKERFVFELQCITDIPVYCDPEVDYVIHLAALTSVSESIDNPFPYERINSYGTSCVFNYALHSNVRKVVYMSSAAVYGHTYHTFSSESNNACPNSPYGLSKYKNELEAEQYHTLYNLPVVGLRLFNVCGKGANKDSVIASWLDKIENGESPEIRGDGSQRRDYIHVLDVVSAICRAALSDEKTNGKVFNVGTGKATSLLDLYQHIANARDKKGLPTPEIKLVPSIKGDPHVSTACTIRFEDTFLLWNPKSIEQSISYITA